MTFLYASIPTNTFGVTTFSSCLFLRLFMDPLALASETSATLVSVMSWSAVRAWFAAPVPLPPHPISPSFNGLLFGFAETMFGKEIEAEPASAAVPEITFLLLRLFDSGFWEFLGIYQNIYIIYIRYQHLMPLDFRGIWPRFSPVMIFFIVLPNNFYFWAFWKM